jgi:hypothetical protein
MMMMTPRAAAQRIMAHEQLQMKSTAQAVQSRTMPARLDHIY